MPVQVQSGGFIPPVDSTIQKEKQHTHIAIREGFKGKYVVQCQHAILKTAESQGLGEGALTVFSLVHAEHYTCAPDGVMARNMVSQNHVPLPEQIPVSPKESEIQRRIPHLKPQLERCPNIVLCPISHTGAMCRCWILCKSNMFVLVCQ